MVQDLVAAMHAAIAEVSRWPSREVLLFHHNDSDGLSSGAILTETFSRRGFSVTPCCLEKPYPAVLELIFRQSQQLLVLADFGGRIAPLISDLNQGRNLVLILDHHKAEPATDSLVHNLDPELFGLHGDREITASVTCYLFACALDPANRDLATMATVGAVGDGFLVDGRLAGPNREVALESQRQGRLEIATGTAERYTMITPQGPILVSALAEDLDTLGAAGYYQDGPALAMAVLRLGPSQESHRQVQRLGAIRDRAFGQEITRIVAGGLTVTPHIQWIHVHHRFAPMGVKMIGVFLETIRDNPDVIPHLDPNRYLAGFQIIPGEIPGFGKLDHHAVKISMRVADPLAAKIRTGQAPGLDTFLPLATGRLGGFSDACHSLTAATTVAIGMEERLIAEMEQILARSDR